MKTSTLVSALLLGCLPLAGGAVPAGAADPIPLTATMPTSIDTTLFVASGPGVRSFVREAVLPAPPAAVYRAWTDGEAFRRAYDPSRDELEAHIDLAIGGRYEWLWDGVTGSNGCQVLAYVPDRMVSFSWNAPPSQPNSRAKRTWVVVELAPAEGGETRVTLTHLGFGSGPEWDETFEYFRGAWAHVLEQFARGLATAAPR